MAALNFDRAAYRGDPLTVEVNVRNSGKTAGDEVAELYLQRMIMPRSIDTNAAGLRAFSPGSGRKQADAFTLSPRD